VEDAEVGDVVTVEKVDGEARPAKKSRFSLTFNDGSAAASTPPTPPEGGDRPEGEGSSSEDAGERTTRASPLSA
jgi:hypothetical protein